MAIEGGILTDKEKRTRQYAAALSVLLSVLLLLAKFWAYSRTNSQAVLSDAVESVVNVVASLLALVVVTFSAKPADRDHPYGHGKIEYFSSAFEGSLITFAAIWIMVEAVKTYLNPEPIGNLDLGVLVVVLTGVCNLFLGIYLIRLGRSHASVALRASGHHVVSDFWTSAGVALGIVLIRMTGILWLDSAIAVVMGLVLAYSGYLLVRESARGLMDEEDVSVLDDLVLVFNRESREGIIQIHHVKVIRSGWYHHIDAHIVLPEFWTVLQASDRITQFEKKVIESYPYGGEMNYHFDPCRRAYCRACDLVNCPVRQAVFEKKLDVSLDQVRSTDEPDEFVN